MKELTVDAVVENVDLVTDFVLEELEEAGCNGKVVLQVSVAIDEIFSNISYYAYSPEVGTATVQVEVLDNPLRVIITFLDNGIPFNPFSIKNPNTSASIENRPAGGLGIFIVKKSMDQVNYEHKEGHNILTIQKNM